MCEELQVPRYSFVIPVYNTERFLRRCIDSLLAQTEKCVEILVVDDCSPGECAKIVEDYGQEIRFFRHIKNKSAFQARRTAILAAKGDYIIPVDPDDYLMPQLLEKANDIINKEHPDVISYWIEYDDGRKVSPHWCRHAQATISGGEAILELCDRKFATGLATKIIKRETLQKALDALPNCEDVYVNTSDDFLMLIPTLLLSRRVSFLDYAGYRYFVNEGSTSFSWKTLEGLRRAAQQIAIVHAKIGEAMVKLCEDDTIGKGVIKLLEQMEAWFSYQALMCDDLDSDSVGRILLESFRGDQVARGAVQCLQELRSSRSFRWAKGVSRCLRRLI